MLTPDDVEEYRARLRKVQKQMIGPAIKDYDALKRQVLIDLELLLSAVEAQGVIDAAGVELLDEYRRFITRMGEGFASLARAWAPAVVALASDGAVQGRALAATHTETPAAPPVLPEVRTRTLDVLDRLAGHNAASVDRMRMLIANNIGKPGGHNTLRRVTGEVVDGAFSHLYTAARTEHLLAFRTAYEDQVVRPGKREVRWVARCNDRTCAYCFSLHGQVFEVGKVPAHHPNCMCVLVPNEEYSHDGISGKQRFDALDHCQQDYVLGREAAKAYRSGRVTLSDFQGDGSQRSWKDVRARKGL
jgi:Phage Mu protein F like protein